MALFKSKIKFQNFQLHSECQLVSALNASYFLGRKFIPPSSAEYDMLLKLTCGQHGSCIQIEKAYAYLNIQFVDVKAEWRSIEFADSLGLPIGISLNTERGFHNVVIVGVDCDSEGYLLKIPNIKFYTKDMWIKWTELEPLITDLPNLGPQYGFFRLFHKHRFTLRP